MIRRAVYLAASLVALTFLLASAPRTSKSPPSLRTSTLRPRSSPSLLRSPALSGALLAASVGPGFYPVFFYPIWVAWQWRLGAAAAAWFTAAFGIVCALIGAWVLAWSQPAPGMSLVAAIVRDTLGHDSDPNGYGSASTGCGASRPACSAGWDIQ